MASSLKRRDIFMLKNVDRSLCESATSEKYLTILKYLTLSSHQCDRIGRFQKFLAINLPTKVAQQIVDNWAIFENINVNTAVDINEATFGNIWATFLSKHLFTLEVIRS